MGNTQREIARARVQKRLGQKQLSRGATTPDSLGSRNTVNGVTFEVAQGDITAESTDAIVNSTDSRFSLNGALSQAIVRRAGIGIRLECQSIGTLTDKGAITSGGALHCKHVVHVLAPRTLPECQSAALAALKLVCSKRLRSVAFPLFGGEAFGLPAYQVASAITNALVKAAQDGACGRIVHNIRLVGFTAADKNAFDSALMQSLGGSRPIGPEAAFDIDTIPQYRSVASRSDSMPDIAKAALPYRREPDIARVAFPDSRENHPDSSAPRASRPFTASDAPRTSSNAISGLKVEATQNDITKEITDAIVNPTSANFALNGGLSRAIASKGGPAIAQECRKLGILSVAGAITSAGQLQCARVIHVLSPTDLNECQAAVRTALKIASNHSLQSISFPLIGCGGGKLRYGQVATCIASEVKNAARRNLLGSIKLVRFVGFNADEFIAFDNALQQQMGRVTAEAEDVVTGRSLAPPVRLPEEQRPMSSKAAFPLRKKPKTREDLKKLTVSELVQVLNDMNLEDAASVCEERAIDGAYFESLSLTQVNDYFYMCDHLDKDRLRRLQLGNFTKL